MTAGTDAISFDGVWVRYDEAVVLEDITLSVREGEILSIVGPNGSGKSTLLRAVMGFVRPYRGSVTVFGAHPDRAVAAGYIGYLPQAGQYDARFPVSAYDVVAMTRFARKGLIERLTTTDREAIDRALTVVDMAGLARAHFGSLSGGQKQRVLIARALAGDPRILLLDEPSTGLDAVAQDAFYQVLRRVRDEKGITIVMVSHDIGSVTAVVDRLACLKGRIHFHGTPGECAPPDALNRIFGENVYLIRHDDETCGTCRKDQDHD